MIQAIFVILTVIVAAAYLGRFIYKAFFSSSNKCTGCAVHKLYEMKLERTKNGSN